jgi:hypothetical protein
MNIQNTLFALTLLITSLSFGQNIFPTTGNVGIGMTTPTNSSTILNTPSVNNAHIYLYSYP